MRESDPGKAAELKKDVSDLDLVIEFYGSKKIANNLLPFQPRRPPKSDDYDINAAYSLSGVMRHPREYPVLSRDIPGTKYKVPVIATSAPMEAIKDDLESSHMSIKFPEMDLIKYEWPAGLGVHELGLGNDRVGTKVKSDLGYEPRDFFPQFGKQPF